MGKKRTSRQRQAARDKARREERVIAVEEAARREDHARLVVQRDGDPRFVQRVRTETGYQVSLNPQAPGGQEVLDLLAGQRTRFQEKFGQEMGDDDPLMFDPNADVPTALTEADMNAGLEELALSVAKSGALDPAYIYAWRDVGYIVTEATEHLFSAVEVQAYYDAVSEHMGLDDSDDAGGDEDWDEDDEPSQQELQAMTADGLEQVVAAIVQEQSLGPIERFMNSVDEFGMVEESAQMLVQSAFGILACWILGAREQEVDASAVMTWIGRHLSAEVSDDTRQLGGMIGFAFSPDLTVSEVMDRLGERFLPTHAALAAGITATAGHGDAHWLRQFDPNMDGTSPGRSRPPLIRRNAVPAEHRRDHVSADQQSCD